MGNTTVPVQQDLERIEDQLCLVAREIGNIAECNCHYTRGLARQIQKTGRRVEDLTVGELLEIDRRYDEVFNRIVHFTAAPAWTGIDLASGPDSSAPYARAPAHTREAETDNTGGVRKQVTEVTGGDKCPERQ